MRYRALQIDADVPEDDRDDDEEDDELKPDAFLRSEAEFAAAHEEYMNSQGNHVAYIHQCLDIFTDLYLLADTLRDLKTANLVMDALIKFSDSCRRSFTDEIINHVYDSTAHGNPLRKLIRDECVYETNSSDYMQMHIVSYHAEFTRDVLVEFLRLRDPKLRETVHDVYQLHGKHGRNVDKCHYHQHDETHPRCAPVPEKERESSTE